MVGGKSNLIRDIFEVVPVARPDGARQPAGSPLPRAMDRPPQADRQALAALSSTAERPHPSPSGRVEHNQKHPEQGTKSGAK